MSLLMSLAGFQSGIAALIRLPIENREKNLKKFLSEYELTDQEYSHLTALAKHEELNKYGNEQAQQRFGSIEKRAGRLTSTVNKEVLRDLWFNHFEPSARTHETDIEGRWAFTIGFLRFLVGNSHARKVLKKKAPVFTEDLIRFQIAETELSRPLLDDPELNPKSSLSHSQFRVLDLKYDIPALLPKLIDKGSKARAQKRDVSVLVLRRGTAQTPRVFEIDQKMRDFLLANLEKGKIPSADAEIKENLSGIGLWKAIH